MTYDQLCDEGLEQEREARAADAEAQIEQERTAELMANGEICRECGEVLQASHGAPAVCEDCGGTAKVSNHYVQGRYFANEADARAYRRFLAEQRARVALRMARYEARRLAAMIATEG